MPEHMADTKEQQPMTPFNARYVVPSRIVEEIAGFLRTQPFTTVHYCGYADEVLIRALVREGRYTLSLMDYWDRHGRESLAFLEEEGLDPSQIVVPEWLDGIPTYIEGAPRHQVLLQDIPLFGPQLDLRRDDDDNRTRRVAASANGHNSSLELNTGRHRPECVILFGKAACAPNGNYEWLDWMQIGVRENGASARFHAQGRLF